MVLLARYVCWGSSLVSGMGTLSSCKKHTTSCSKLYGTVVVFLPKWKFCSRTMIWKTPDNPPMFSQNECPSQRSDLNLTEMLWHNLKQAVNSKQTNKQKPSSITELKQVGKEELTKISPQWCEIFIASYCSSWHNRFFFRFRGHLTFSHWAIHVGLDSFSLNRWKCILGLVALPLSHIQICLMTWNIWVWQKIKKLRSRWGKFFTPGYI